MIGILIFDRFQILDAAGPIAVFEMAKRLSPDVPRIEILATEAEAIRSSSGVEMLARSLATLEDALSTLIVVGGEGVEQAARCPVTLATIRAAAESGARIASVCSGSFILAEAGVFDGRPATTHWSLTREFIGRFPGVRFKPDQIFTRDNQIWTSAGISAGIDLALAMVAEDHGDAVSQAAARQLVLYDRRSGGQSQFSSLLELKPQSGRFAVLLSWIRENLCELLTVEDLADRVGMSSRHFARAFAAETGITPAKAIERLRLEVARDRVRLTSEPIESVARATGFEDPERMRRAFIRTFGQPPQSLRRVAREQSKAP